MFALVASSLCNIVNSSISNGIHPIIKAEIRKNNPYIYKSGDDTDPNNYRPISLLSIFRFNRLFEKTMYTRLKSFLDDII